MSVAMEYPEILKDWNFWEDTPSTGYPRQQYINKLINWLKLPEIVALYGVRRSGKSTLLLQLIEKAHKKLKVPYINFLYINFEDPRLGKVTATDLFELLKVYKKEIRPKGRIYLFLDEVQRIKEWERFALTLYEQKQNIKIFVTGSSSTLLNTELATLLSGRMLMMQVMPLNFSEYLEFKKQTDAEKVQKLKLLDEYLKYGGFPRVVLEETAKNKRAILTSYYNTILEKDVILRNKIDKKQELKNLAQFIMSNSAGLISTYKLKNILGLSTTSISKYIDYLAQSFLISQNNFFSYSVKKQIYNPGKIYAADTGLANTAGFNFSENKGRLLETIVNNKLIQEGKKLFYWKNGTETDLITFTGKDVEKLINVTLTVDDPQVLERELNSLEIAGEKLNVDKGQQTLLTLYNESGQGDKRIVDLLDFLET